MLPAQAQALQAPLLDPSNTTNSRAALIASMANIQARLRQGQAQSGEPSETKLSAQDTAQILSVMEQIGPLLEEKDAVGSSIDESKNEVTLFFSKKLAAVLGVDETLAISLETNVIRDWPWGSISQLNWDQTPSPTNSEWGQFYGQQLYPSLFMIAYLIGVCRKPESRKDAIISFFAAAAAIGPWDYFQYKGTTDWLPSCCTIPDDAIPFWAGLFPGLAEGPTQYVVSKLGGLLSKAEERRKFIQDPKAYIKKVVVELGLSVTIGAIPGNVWQWVYAACLFANLPAALTGFLVAAAVCTANYGTTKVIGKIMAKYDEAYPPVVTREFRLPRGDNTLNIEQPSEPPVVTQLKAPHQNPAGFQPGDFAEARVIPPAKKQQKRDARSAPAIVHERGMELSRSSSGTGLGYMPLAAGMPATVIIPMPLPS